MSYVASAKDSKIRRRIEKEMFDSAEKRVHRARAVAEKAKVSVEQARLAEADALHDLYEAERKLNSVRLAFNLSW